MTPPCKAIKNKNAHLYLHQDSAAGAIPARCPLEERKSSDPHRNEGEFYHSARLERPAVLPSGRCQAEGVARRWKKRAEITDDSDGLSAGQVACYADTP